MGKLLDKIGEGQVLVSDGAWGTYLYQKGLAPGECPDIWSVDHTADVVEIAASYISAGADMVETNSFGASSIKLRHYGLEKRAVEINEAAARASRLAAGNRLVLGSMGPTGKLLIMEEVTREELVESFREQAMALERGGADALCIETMSDAAEACCAIQAARESTSLDVIATFTFERTVQGEYRTMMGLSPVDAVKAALEAGAHVVGTNCGNGMERMTDIVEEMKAAYPAALLLVHANAGLPRQVEGRDVFPETPEDMAAQVGKLIQAGAVVIGGCCGTTPAHIAAIRRAVDDYRR